MRIEFNIDYDNEIYHECECGPDCPHYKPFPVIPLKTVWPNQHAPIPLAVCNTCGLTQTSCTCKMAYGDNVRGAGGSHYTCKWCKGTGIICNVCGFHEPCVHSNPIPVIYSNGDPMSCPKCKTSGSLESRGTFRKTKYPPLFTAD